MSVTAHFEPAFVSSVPGVPAALTLCVHNDADVAEVIKLKASGELAGQMVVQPATVTIEAGETFEVPVVVDLGTALLAGPHTSGVEISTADGPTVTAEATISVEEASSYTVALNPPRSTSAIAGRHHVSIDNTGNVPIAFELLAMEPDGNVDVELATPVINVDAGKTTKVEVRVHPKSKFWNGLPQQHDFSVHVTGSDDETHELTGSYEQGPRLRPWWLPALVGMVGALAIGTIAWFTLLKPSVETIAEDRAAAANEADQTRLDEKIVELDAAAADARDLPLGTPADLRFTADAAPGGSATDSFTLASDRVLSITDVVFQNPDGSVGRIALMRNDEVLLESQLANFRDLDFHFVAPFRVEGSDLIQIKVDCQTPGPNTPSCVIGATIVGFVAEAE